MRKLHTCVCSVNLCWSYIGGSLSSHVIVWMSLLRMWLPCFPLSIPIVTMQSGWKEEICSFVVCEMTIYGIFWRWLWRGTIDWLNYSNFAMCEILLGTFLLQDSVTVCSLPSMYSYQIMLLAYCCRLWRRHPRQREWVWFANAMANTRWEMAPFAVH